MIQKYFKSSLIASIIGLLLAAAVGFYYTQTWAGALNALFIAGILAILEISLSFDNAIVNASVLERMTDLWKHRFLTWGMIIAVFGMRLVFPVAIVSAIGGVNPLESLRMALFEPVRYAEMMLSIHSLVCAFGGMFLLMVSLKYFFDEAKEVHWISIIEKPLLKLGKLEAIETVLALLVLIVLSRFLAIDHRLDFVLAGISGLITYLCVDAIGSYLESSKENAGKDAGVAASASVKNLHQASLGLFIYLEVLDASFSFDGVVGAFAITNNLLVIMIGLGIGAFFVRSLTILFVEKKTLSQYMYIEHGAFYAIIILAGIMLVDPFLAIPEWITGLSGAAVIGLSLLSSLRVQDKQPNN